MALSRQLGCRVFQQDVDEIELMVQREGFTCVAEYLRSKIYTDLGKPVPVRQDTHTIPFIQPKKKIVAPPEDLSELTEREFKLNQILKTS